jgi:hypothetical protein
MTGIIGSLADVFAESLSQILRLHETEAKHSNWDSKDHLVSALQKHFLEPEAHSRVQLLQFVFSNHKPRRSCFHCEAARMN